jgi:hypothetical protein
MVDATLHNRRLPDVSAVVFRCRVGDDISHAQAAKSAIVASRPEACGTVWARLCST